MYLFLNSGRNQNMVGLRMLPPGLPGQEACFEQEHDAVEGKGHHDQGKDGHENQGRVVLPAGNIDEEPQALVGADEFTHHRADHQRRRKRGPV